MIPACEWITQPDATALAEQMASRWIQRVQQARADRAKLSVALSGGRGARLLFEALTRQSARQPVPTKPLEFFWADERCVPPDHPDSNFRLARELLFEPLRIPPAQLHRIRGECPPAQAAREANVELARLVPAPPSQPPVLDLILLGLGEDGHIASLFPDASPETVHASAAYLHVVGPKPPPHRITMSYAVLRAARLVWVLATGAAKAAALRESVRPHGRTPLARLLQQRTHTTLFTDLPPS